MHCIPLTTPHLRTPRISAAVGLLILASAAYAKVEILPSSTPVKVLPGTAVTFTANVPVIWSLAPGSEGTIDQDGVYHAPANITPQQSVGGCQLLPNSHVFNTRIDTLPVHTNSDVWIHDSLAGVGGSGLKYGPSFPINYFQTESPTTNLAFLYTSAHNAKFQLLPFPYLRMESGYWTWDIRDKDRHAIFVNPTTCQVEELYNYYPTGFVRSCPNCNSQSGVTYGMMDAALVDLATDAAGMQLLPLTFRLDEIRAGAINHALRFTIDRTDDHWMWPATTSAAFAHSPTRMPMGARVRLKASVETPSHPIARILVTQLKQYGLILADRGLNWDIQGIEESYPDDVRAAFAEVRSKITAADMEVIDETTLMVAPSSGDTTAGVTEVIATSQTDVNDTARRVIVLSGVSVGVASNSELIQAGSSPKQLTAWTNGTGNAGIVWSMSPELGNLSTDGAYTPPETVDAPTTTTITAASAVDPSVTASIQVTVLPPGVIRINAGDPVDLIDHDGNTWWGDNIPGREAMGFTDGSYPYDFTSGYNWALTPEPGLYIWGRASLSDIVFRMTVPNGNYKITLKLAENAAAENLRRMNLETQGRVIYSDFDIFQAAGGSQKAIDVTMPATVQDGTLYVALRQRGRFPSVIDSCCSAPIYPAGFGPVVSAIQIAPDLGRPALTISPSNGGSINIYQTKQFFAVPWYKDNIKVKWTISPAIGSIDQNGLYSPPLDLIGKETLVTVTATSTDDPSLFASAQIRLLPGIGAIRINCGTLPGFIDANGNVWSGDYGFSADTVAYDRTDVLIANTTPDLQPLYQSSRYRYDDQSFYYSFPVPNISYRVTLRFADYTFLDFGRHVFDVKINGTTVLSNFDPNVAAGRGNTAVDRTFTVLVTNKQLRIDFIGHKGGAFINGIEIVPMLDAQPR